MIKSPEVIVLEEAEEDIQSSIRWYNQQKHGLGRRFYTEVYQSIEQLESVHFFQIRYDNSRCLPLKKFPFMIHFSLDEQKNTIYIQAVFHTSRDPKIWKKRE